MTAEKDRMRGTGGNRFIEADATRADLMRTINDQLGDLHEWAGETGRALDLAEVTISTKRIRSGRISVSVTADLAPSNPPGNPDIPLATEDGIFRNTPPDVRCQPCHDYGVRGAALNHPPCDSDPRLSTPPPDRAQAATRPSSTGLDESH